MQSKPVVIGFQGLYTQETKSDIGFERFAKGFDNDNSTSYPSDNQMPVSSLPFQINKNSYSGYSSSNSKSMPSSSHLSKQDGKSYFPQRRLFSPLLSAIYTEIVTDWFKGEWLIFTDNHKETFLTFNCDRKGHLTVQMALNEKCFINSKLPLRYRPECLLIRTSRNNQCLLLPNSIISLEHLFDINKNSSEKSAQGKLIAMICNPNETQNSQLMFYKDSSTNHWYIFTYDQIKPSQSYSDILSNDHQKNLEAILQEDNRTNFIHPSKLSFPLSALCNNPITYVYLTAGI